MDELFDSWLIYDHLFISVCINKLFVLDLTFDLFQPPKLSCNTCIYIQSNVIEFYDWGISNSRAASTMGKKFDDYVFVWIQGYEL